MNHHKFNYLSSAGAARSGSNYSHSSKLTSARFAGITAAHVAQSPIINFTSPLPSLSSSSPPNTTTTMNAITSTYSPLSSSSGRYPIRLSPSALPYFISTIIYTIEFHAPVGPRPLPSETANKSSSVTSRIFFSSGGNSSSNKNNNNWSNNNNNRSTRSSLQGPRNSSIAINDQRHGISQLQENNNNSNSSFAESTAMINTLPSSVFSAVSAIFGRTPLQVLTPQLKPQNMSTSHNYINEHNNNMNNYGCNGIDLDCTGGDEFGYHEEFIIDDEVLRRAQEQPLVSPCTQIIHELGNVHIVVRERHNPTVEMAYNQALCDIRMILGRCREKMEKELCVRSQSQQQQQEQQHQRFHSSFTANRLASSQWSNNINIDTINNNSINNKEIPAISVYGNESVNDHSMSVPAYCCSGNSHNSSKVNIGQTDHYNNKNECTSGGNRNMPNNNSSRFTASPPITYSTLSLLPLSEPPSLMRLESPSIRHDSNAIQNSSNLLSSNNNYRERPCYDVQPDEVGMYLSVRLLTRETKWILSHERPLAEWTFPIIRTCDEATIKYCHKSTSPCANFQQNEKCYAPTNNNSSNATKMSLYHRKESEVDHDANTTSLPLPPCTSSISPSSSRLHDCNTCTDHVVRVNDANQIRDVLQFILKTFYDAISLQTFVDFTAGELIFDARVTERRSFYEAASDFF